VQRLGSIAAALLFLPSTAGAQAPAVPVALSIDVCLASLDAADVRRIAELELGAPLVPIHAATELTTRATASCDGDEVVLRVEDPLTAKVTERRVRLEAEDPRGRERFLALALVELIAASWSELESTEPAARPETIAPEVREAALDVVHARREPYGPPLLLSITAEAHTRLVLGGVWPLFGGGVRFGLQPVPFLAIRAGFLAEAGDAQVQAGSVSMQSYGGTFAIELAGTLVPDPISVELGGGAGAHLAHGILTGRTSSEMAVGTTVEGLFASVSAIGVARLVIRPFVLELRYEVGHAIARIAGTIDGRTAVELGGPWMSLALGVGYRG
jgi:hypothetical protein